MAVYNTSGEQIKVKKDVKCRFCGRVISKNTEVERHFFNKEGRLFIQYQCLNLTCIDDFEEYKISNHELNRDKIREFIRAKHGKNYVEYQDFLTRKEQKN